MLGSDKQYGALAAPHLGTELRGLVRSGRVYDLSFSITSETPYSGTTSPFSMRPKQRHDESPVGGAFGEATEIIRMSAHVSTHLDAICHVSERVNDLPVLYGDIPAVQVEGEKGFTSLGVELCPPILVRGVLLDIPGSKDLDVLPDCYGITVEDIKTCLSTQGTDVRAGDCVLVRTGFSRYRHCETARYVSVGAGPTPDACVWLAQKGIALTGSDTQSYEQVPSSHAGHMELIRRRGIPMLKQVNLDELAADSVYEFLFIALPLRLVGATASPVTPIAVC